MFLKKRSIQAGQMVSWFIILRTFAD